jgi:hypothetical protein
MGKEYEMYDVEAITLFRNDPRISSFNEILLELQQRAPTLDKTPHWVLSTPDLVPLLTLTFNEPNLPSYGDFVCIFSAVTDETYCQVAKLSADQELYKIPLEKKFVEQSINGEKLATMKEEDLLALCDLIVAGPISTTNRKILDKRDDLFRELMRVKQTCEMQLATMRHFEE